MTNAVVVRRVLGELREGGIVDASKGPNGGWTLMRPAEDITLHQVYSAMGERLLIRTESDPAAIVAAKSPANATYPEAITGGLK